MDSLESHLEMLNIDDNKEEKWIKHYSSTQKMLLVGDGDFSFAVCLAEAFGSATSIVASSLYSEGNNISPVSVYICLIFVGCNLIDPVLTKLRDDEAQVQWSCIQLERTGGTRMHCYARSKCTYHEQSSSSHP
jgi:hypothetical protein